MTLHLKSRGYPFRPRVLFSSFIVVGVGFPNCVLFQERTIFKKGGNRTSPLVNICKATRGEDRENPWADTLHYNELIYASLVANV